MAYNPDLADRVRAIIGEPVEERRMMGSLAFCVNGRIAVGVSGDEAFFPVGGGAALDVALTRGAHRLTMPGGRSAPFAALTDPPDDVLADWIAEALERLSGR
ncbi:hypothetical protein [Microbacterium sp. ZXX196]|uniref:hypothetical protein n=1 Tax=Microbacterium sp. ZXX196 TaxID=2609291 RepID=UPI0012BA3139|nr:hypothetical protein [Microbacterium sp. ZXX196]MTE23861.1 hypothetical protein [Microbacterium sp. ZXX196]